MLTAAVFQSEIGPYVVVAVAGEVVHKSRAAAILAFVMQAW